MREILSDWGVDLSHFQKLSRDVKASYGYGVTVNDTVMQLDNQYAKGKVDFFPVGGGVAVLRLNISFAETIRFKRILKHEPSHYACLFSLKEGVDFHAFDSMEKDEMNRLGLSAKHSALFFSADVQTEFTILPNEHTRIVILILERDTLLTILQDYNNKKYLDFFSGQSVKGYASMSAEMIDKVTTMMEYSGPEDILSLRVLGDVFQLLAGLFEQITKEREMLVQSTGIIEVARIVQIRNLLVSDFSKQCPLLEEMAKMAQMSTTKFKTLFKKIFKLPYYQYYQHHRLLASRQAIILGKSVSETAYEFSFSSTGNFSAAFKKMFKISPSEIESLKQ